MRRQEEDVHGWGWRRKAEKKKVNKFRPLIDAAMLDIVSVRKATSLKYAIYDRVGCVF